MKSFFVLSFLLLWSTAAAQLRVCYISNWSQYRPGLGSFFPTMINGALCTHIMYSFANMQGNRLIAFEWNDDSTDWSTGLYEQATNLKYTNPSLKVTLAVGGWNMGTAPMSAMLATAANRNEFVTTSIAFLRSRSFDGLDLDFEYPGARGSPAGDKFLFTNLVNELRIAFDAEAVNTGRAALLLTIAVAAGKTNIDGGYEIPALSSAVDFFNLMTYDLNGAWDTQTGLNSPLFSRPDESGDVVDGNSRDQLNIDWAANYWASQGAPKNKLAIGLATYGRALQLTNAAQNGLGAPIRGAGTAGTYTREAGFLSYYEICDFLATGGTRVYSDVQHSPYAYNGDQWVGYDDLQSLEMKVNYIKINGYAGWMIWNLDLDDFSGLFCGGQQYPLTTNLNLFLNGIVPTGSPTNAPPTTTTKVPYTGPPTAAPTVPGGGPFCGSRSDGFYPNPDSCLSYYQCANGADHFWECIAPLYYDDVILVCNWQDQLSDARKAECGL